MFKLALFCLIAFSIARFGKTENYKLWVLSLGDDGLDFNRLSSPDKSDTKIFKSLMEPSIQRYVEENEGLVQVPESNPSILQEKPAKGKIYKLKADIMQILNKFSMSHLSEMQDNDFEYSQPSLKLYFFGPYTSLIVNSGSERFHYFIQPPSTLPGWFYQKHENNEAMYVDIPEQVKYEFYQQLLNLLTFFFSYPV